MATLSVPTVGSTADYVTRIAALFALFPDSAVRSWTPAATFATPGNLSITYSVQVGDYFVAGPLTVLTFSIVSSGFTHTTASGALRITGIPTTAATSANYLVTGSMLFNGITKANYTQYVPAIASAGTFMTIEASGSGQSTTGVTAADTPTGGTLGLRGFVVYRTT